jgi:hypothetical protein
MTSHLRGNIEGCGTGHMAAGAASFQQWAMIAIPFDDQYDPLEAAFRIGTNIGSHEEICDRYGNGAHEAFSSSRIRASGACAMPAGARGPEYSTPARLFDHLYRLHLSIHQRNGHEIRQAVVRLLFVRYPSLAQ